jgi:hypothetical protein
LSRRADVAQGTTEKPMTRTQLLEKARDCAGLVMPPEQAEQLIAVVEQLEHEPDLTRLVRALRPSGPAVG